MNSMKRIYTPTEVVVTPEEGEEYTVTQMIPEDVEMSDEEQAEHLAFCVNAQIGDLKVQALDLLVGSDSIYRVCQELAIPIPATWLAYKNTLRNIARTGVGSIPEKPVLPTA